MFDAPPNLDLEQSIDDLPSAATLAYRARPCGCCLDGVLFGADGKPFATFPIPFGVQPPMAEALMIHHGLHARLRNLGSQGGQDVH